MKVTGYLKAAARRLAALLSIGSLVVGCQVVGDVVPPEQMKLSVLNATSKELVLVVNSERIDDLRPGVQRDLPAARLPPLPWTVEVRLPEGRGLLSLTVRVGDVATTRHADGSVEQRGDGARIDLSCGRIDLWSGPPLIGPAPGPGSSGDCDP